MLLRRYRFPCLLFYVDSGKFGIAVQCLSSLFSVFWWLWFSNYGFSGRSQTVLSYFQSSSWYSELSSLQRTILPSILFPMHSSLATTFPLLVMAFTQKSFWIRKTLENMINNCDWKIERQTYECLAMSDMNKFTQKVCMALMASIIKLKSSHQTERQNMFCV